MLKIELEPIDEKGCCGEAYKVLLTDDKVKNLNVGTVTRMTPEGEWAFRPCGEAPGIALTLQAADVAELRSVVAARFGMVHGVGLDEDRLQHASMEDLTAHMLRSLNVLAARTGSMPGFAAAMARTVAMMIAEDVKPGHEDTFKQNFMGQVDKEVDVIRSANKLRGSVHSFLDSLFRTEYQPDSDSDNDDDTVKH